MARKSKMTFDEGRDLILAGLDDDALQGLRLEASELFAAMADPDKTYHRSPPFGLRLYADSYRAMLAVKPIYQRSQKRVVTSSMQIQVLQSIAHELEGQRCYNNHCAFKLTLHSEKPRVDKFWPARLDAGIEAFNEIAADFANDARGVIANCSAHCCFCGRALTDGESRSRGIGPECFSYLQNRLTTAPLFTPKILNA